MGNFNPTFYETDLVDHCADAINQPHEDYPVRVAKTTFVLKSLCELALDGIEFDTNILKATHSVIFNQTSGMGVGKLRVRAACVVDYYTGEVHNYPDPFEVPELLEAIMPVEAGTKEELIDWYTKFQEIHPFDDGNGRVGGVVVAALHYAKTGRYLCPNQ